MKLVSKHAIIGFLDLQQKFVSQGNSGTPNYGIYKITNCNYVQQLVLVRFFCAEVQSRYLKDFSFTLTNN